MAAKKSAKTILEELESSNRERVMFSMDKELQQRLKKVCAERQIRMSSVIERLVENFLNDLSEAGAETNSKSQDKRK